MKISKDVKGHVLVFTDGSNKFIDNEIAIKIFNLSARGGINGFDINGAYYKFTMIAKILTIEEFYSQYPDKRPQHIPTYKNYTTPYNFKRQSKNALREMIKGLKGYIKSDRYQGTDKPIKLLKKMEYAYNNRKS